MHQFLVEPTPPQRKYLASISQGFFLYHLHGLDPTCTILRAEIFHETLWICDSSILLPLQAVGCYNNQYAFQLFSTLRSKGAAIYTTEKLIQESWEHFSWFVNFIYKNPPDSREFLEAASLQGNYKQNLFLDGYIRMNAEGQIGSFKDYLVKIGIDGSDKARFKNWFYRSGVKLLGIESMQGFGVDDITEMNSASDKIQKERIGNGTYHSKLQVEAEAEVWMIIKNLTNKKYSLPDAKISIEKTYFLSQSRILDRVFTTDISVSWTAEALFRYISALPERVSDPDLLQQCMLSEYFYAGISFIDKERYVKFFGPYIDTSKRIFKEEKEAYLAVTQSKYVDVLDSEFENTPDLEKPFFVAYMGWKVADAAKEREDIAKLKAAEAEEKVKKLEREKESNWKRKEKAHKKQEEARLRHLHDLKHLKKRENQREKRKRKK